MLQMCVNQESPTTSRTLRKSGRLTSTPGALPQRPPLHPQPQWKETPPPSRQTVLPHGEACVRDCGGLPSGSIPSPDPQHPELKTAVPHSHHIQCWWCHASHSCAGRWWTRISSMHLEVILHGLSEILLHPSFCLPNHRIPAQLCTCCL